MESITYLSWSRQEIIPQDSAGFGFPCKANSLVHIEIRVGGCDAVDGAKDKQYMELFFTGALTKLSDLTHR
jgi:hypothetical protein